MENQFDWISFYDDYEKIQLILGDNQKTDNSSRFIVRKDNAWKYILWI